MGQDGRRMVPSDMLLHGHQCAYDLTDVRAHVGPDDGVSDAHASTNDGTNVRCYRGHLHVLHNRGLLRPTHPLSDNPRILCDDVLRPRVPRANVTTIFGRSRTFYTPPPIC